MDNSDRRYICVIIYSDGTRYHYRRALNAAEVSYHIALSTIWGHPDTNVLVTRMYRVANEQQ